MLNDSLRFWSGMNRPIASNQQHESASNSTAHLPSSALQCTWISAGLRATCRMHAGGRASRIQQLHARFIMLSIKPVLQTITQSVQDSHSTSTHTPHTTAQAHAPMPARNARTTTALPELRVWWISCTIRPTKCVHVCVLFFCVAL